MRGLLQGGKSLACWPFQQPQPNGLALRSLRREDYPSPGAFALACEPMLEQALPARRMEFTAGRMCAAAALADLGHEPAWLSVAIPYRYARFPLGAVGSISHTDSLAVACAADSQAYASVGVDAESIAWHSELCAMARQVLSSGEHAQLESMPPAKALRFFFLCFSAKEAFYKAIFPLCHVAMDFHEAELASWDEQGRFCLRLISSRTAPWFSYGQLFDGCWAEQGETLLTLLTIRNDVLRGLRGGAAA